MLNLYEIFSQPLIVPPAPGDDFKNDAGIDPRETATLQHRSQADARS
jgi:hypothetical protein